MTTEQALRLARSQVNPEWKKSHRDWVFLRRALKRDLIGNGSEVQGGGITPAFIQAQPYAREVGKEKINEYNESYLVRFPTESSQAYAQRFILAIDGGESYRVLSEFIGHVMRTGYTLNLDDFSAEIQNKIMRNIDGDGANFDMFICDVIFEIAGIGKGYFWTTNDDSGDGMPMTEAIHRDKFRDWRKEGTDFDYVIFQICENYSEGIERDEQDLTCIITRDEWIYVDLKKETVEIQPNPLGFVPVIDGWQGAMGKSIVDGVAKLQFLTLNSESVLAQKIRNQGLAILTGPVGTRTQLATLSTNKVVEISADSTRGIEWAAYPASSLDGDYKYLQLLMQRMEQLSAVRTHYDAASLSGESKMWDFLSQKALLETIATSTEEAVNGILNHWAAYLGVDTQAERFKLSRNYDARGLKETLELIFQASSLSLGETVQGKLKMSARDALRQLGVNLTEEEKAASDGEILNQNSLMKNLETLGAMNDTRSNNGKPEQSDTGDDDAGDN